MRSPPPELEAWHRLPAASAFVEEIGAFFQSFGFKRNHGRIWGTLYLSPRPLEQAELGALLGLSAGLISSGLRELEQIGAVREIPLPGSRRGGWEAEQRLLRTVASILTRRDLEAVLALRVAVRAARAGLPQGTTKAWLHERLGLMEDVTQLYETLAGLVVRVSRLRESALGPIIRGLRDARALLPGRHEP